MDGNGGCCIARWGDGGHGGHGYDMSKMDMIMLKFRPIAPKPVSENGAVSGVSDTPDEGRHANAKAASKGRRKSSKKNNNGKKRKSLRRSPDNDEEKREGVTLLPLFPEAPDLSPKGRRDYNITPMFEDNYGNCHGTRGEI